MRSAAYYWPMEILVIGFLIVIGLVGWAPKEATQVALIGVWGLMGVTAVGAVLWSILRLLF